MPSSLAWGILSTGAIAKAFARGLVHSRTGKLVAVASRTQEAADKFAKEFNVPRAHGSYEALLADPQVQAIYIAPPHPMHAQWTILAAEAKKHILCEKPIGLNAAETMAMIEAARANNVFLMEAFMYRCHPQTQRLVELLKSKAIGEVRMIHATFGFSAGFHAESRIWSNALAGGGIMDVGCYPISMSRLVAGVVLGRDFAEPIDIKASGKLASTGVDEYAAATLTFPNQIVAQVATGVGLNLDNSVRIFGTSGSIFVPSPWTADRGSGGDYHLHVTRYGKGTEDVVIKADVTAYALEADVVGDAVAQGKTQPPSPAMTWDDSLGNMRALDTWRARVGVVYDAEKRGASSRTVSGRTLKKSNSASMTYGRLPGVDKPVSRLLLGVDNQTFYPHATVMFDDYFERGGNAFDTAYIYAGGELEKNLGAWIQSRGVREQVVILGKGAHTPHCTPKHITEQLAISLDRMQTNYVDVYMLHRDNVDIPVGEFVDVLNEHKKAGRIRAFGGSNWTLERVQAANDYAKAKGLTGFAAVSNNFSLARMIDPVWDGCVGTSDPASRAWFEKTQLALMPWSSQARGFFLPHISRDYTGDAEVVRCWFSEDNFQRRDRAIELAKKKGVEPINIALAYVLHQPFPTFPLIGPRTIGETISSLRALNVQLTSQEIKWLNLEA
ncbi:MAG: aldo/keto reductase [Phycisphaeraceae bacterium]|nr:aldo/keto reductase [Phycisphaeraceae bacterium]